MTRSNPLGELIERIWEERPAAGLAGDYVPGSNRRVEAVARMLRGGERLLDLGCGAGALAQVVGPRYREIHGLDLASRAVDAARARGVRARVWDLNECPWPYPDGQFDAVTALSVIQYVIDPPAVAREAARVARPGGVVCFGAPNLRALWRVLRLAVFGRFPRVTRDPGYDGGTIHYFCRRDVRDLLEGAGLTTSAVRGAFLWPRWLEGWADGVPGLGGVARELLAGEVLVFAHKAARP